jgi:hypothetical protein
MLNRVFFWMDSMFWGTLKSKDIFLSIVARGDVPLLWLNSLRVPQITQICSTLVSTWHGRAKALRCWSFLSENSFKNGYWTYLNIIKSVYKISEKDLVMNFIGSNYWFWLSEKDLVMIFIVAVVHTTHNNHLCLWLHFFLVHDCVVIGHIIWSFGEE